MKKRMKYLIPGLLLLLSCSASQTEEQPTDLAGLKQMLKQKKLQANNLATEIAELERSIEELDSNVIQPSSLVTTIQPGQSTFEHYVTVQGAVEAEDLIDVSSEVSGRIVKMSLEEGDYVRKGQLVATLDLESLNNQISELEKSLELANDVFERQERLWKQNIGSEIQYLQAKNNKERLEESLSSLEFELTKSKVFAPTSGMIDRVIAETGEVTMAGAPIVQILNTSQLTVVADVPENMLTAVKRGDMVEIQFPAIGDTRHAKVTLIGREIDKSNRTFKIEMDIVDRSGMLKPNLLADIKIRDIEETDVVVIPIELVQQEISGEDYVLVVDVNDKNEKVASKVYVETGNSYEGNIVITSGLDGTETLIMDGARSVNENEMIEIDEPSTVLGDE